MTKISGTFVNSGSETPADLAHSARMIIQNFVGSRSNATVSQIVISLTRILQCSVDSKINAQNQTVNSHILFWSDANQA